MSIDVWLNNLHNIRNEYQNLWKYLHSMWIRAMNICEPMLSLEMTRLEEQNWIQKMFPWTYDKNLLITRNFCILLFRVSINSSNSWVEVEIERNDLRTSTRSSPRIPPINVFSLNFIYRSHSMFSMNFFVHLDINYM